MGIVCFSIHLDNCINYWKIYFSEVQSKKPVQVLIKNYLSSSWEATAMICMFVFITIASITILIILNKTELKAMTCSIKEYREKKQTEKQQKQEAKKQRKIQALEKELENLKDK